VYRAEHLNNITRFYRYFITGNSDIITVSGTKQTVRLVHKIEQILQAAQSMEVTCMLLLLL